MVWKFGMVTLGLLLLANAGWMLYEQPPISEFNYWPLVTIDVLGFVFSLLSIFRIAFRKDPMAHPAPAPREPDEGPSTQEKVR